MSITLTINDTKITAEKGMTILEAAESNDIYIPRLCYHPSLGSSHGLKPVDKIYRDDKEFKNDGSGPKEGFVGCQLCLVELKGKNDLVTACDTIVEDGMEIQSESDKVKKKRMGNLVDILRDHPHACLQCAQQEGCSRTQCSTNVPENERCCPLLGHCELQKIAQYIGIRQDLTKYVFQDLPKHSDEPLFERDDNLCISCLRCVRACRELRGIETIGFVFNKGKVYIGPTKSSQYDASDCRFCTTCVEVCPTGALTDKDLPSGEKEDVLVPCIANCPAGIDIPRYIHLINKGNYSEAIAVIREKVPFPEILGRVCFHPCEEACRRGEINQPMAICALKWFAAENDKGSTKIQPIKSTGKTVAIVGSGPSGLSVAYYLARVGHGVTIFESEEKIGGMLRYAIPDYRLPPEILDKEFQTLEDLKVKFKTNTHVGKDYSIADLQNEHDAVFIGSGAWLSKKIPVEGSEMEGILWGLDFLKAVKKKEITTLKGRFVVIGGGNVAMDVARSAIRLGAEEVQLACLECSDEMPAHDWEIEEAKEEGVIMHTSWGPASIRGINGKVTGIDLVKCISVFDRKGAFAPEFDSCETKSIDTDQVILAVGQTADLSWVEPADVKQGMISVNKQLQTSIPGVFAGGEATRGPASVVEAVADGATAASAIDKYLGGDGNIYPSFSSSEKPDPYIGRIEGFASMKRVDTSKTDPKVRKKNFETIDKCYTQDQVKQESDRCLRCDLRLQILPVTLPPDRWQELTDDNVADVPASEGVIQLRDENKVVIVIKGTQNMQADLKEKLGSETKARYFLYESDPMYTKRESELIQQYLQQFGKMPEGDGKGDDLDDLF